MQVAAYFLVVAERRAAMHQRIVIALRQALRFGRHVGLVEIAQEYGGKAFHVADPRAVVIPGRARGLIGLVEVLDVQSRS